MRDGDIDVELMEHVGERSLLSNLEMAQENAFDALRKVWLK